MRVGVCPGGVGGKAGLQAWRTHLFPPSPVRALEVHCPSRAQGIPGKARPPVDASTLASCIRLPRPRSNPSPVGPLALGLRDRDRGVTETGVGQRGFPFQVPLVFGIFHFLGHLSALPGWPSCRTLPAGLRSGLLGALQGMFPSGSLL